jgi:hypothetical protein
MNLMRLSFLAAAAWMCLLNGAVAATIVDFNEVYSLNTVIPGYGSPPITLPTTTTGLPTHPQTADCSTLPLALRAQGPFNSGQATFSTFVGKLDAATSDIDCDSNFSADPDIILLSNINPGRVLSAGQQAVWTATTLALEFQFNTVVSQRFLRDGT